MQIMFYKLYYTSWSNLFKTTIFYICSLGIFFLMFDKLTLTELLSTTQVKFMQC